MAWCVSRCTRSPQVSVGGLDTRSDLGRRSPASLPSTSRRGASRAGSSPTPTGTAATTPPRRSTWRARWPPSTWTSWPTRVSSRSASSGPVDGRGPLRGRPSKLYRLAAEELAASIPDRHYDSRDLCSRRPSPSRRAAVDRCGTACGRRRMPPGASLARRRQGLRRGCDAPTNVAPRSSRCSPATGTNPRSGGEGRSPWPTPLHRLAEQERELARDEPRAS